MNVITLATVENGANSFKLRMQFSPIKGSSNISMYCSIGMSYPR